MNSIFRFSDYLVPVVGGLFVFAASYFLSQSVFFDAPLTTDENAYIFQAHCFADGVIARPAPEPMRMFPSEMLIMKKQVGWLSRYPPAHAAWLVPGILAGHPRIMISLAAFLSFLVLSRLAIIFGFSTYLFPVLLLFSPYFLFMYGTMLSHTSGLLAVSLLLFTYVRWKQTGTILYSVIAGLAWAWFFLNRTYTGALLALPFAIDALVDLPRHRRWKNFAGTLLFAFCSGLGALVFLAYNNAAVGNPWTPTYLYYQASDALGFGPRPVGQIPAQFTFIDGVRAMWENLHLLDHWLLGIPGSLLLTLGLGIFGWNKRWSPLCLASAVIVWLGYVLFWFEGVRLVGPVYYYETLPFLLVFLSFGLKKMYQLPVLPEYRKSMYVTICCVLFIGCSLSFSWQQAGIIRAWQGRIGEYQRLLKQAPKNSLILVSKIEGMNYLTRGMAFNPRGLASDPLIVHTGKLHNRILVGSFPERTPYRLIVKNGHLALQPFAENRPIRYSCAVTDTCFRTGEDVVSADGPRTRVARNSKDGADWLAYGEFFWVAPGKYLLQVSLQVQDVSPDAPLIVDVAIEHGRTILARQDVVQVEGGLVTVPFEVDHTILVEPRIFYNGTGNVSAGMMAIVQLDEGNKQGVVESLPEGSLDVDKLE